MAVEIARAQARRRAAGVRQEFDDSVARRNRSIRSTGERLELAQRRKISFLECVNDRRRSRPELTEPRIGPSFRRYSENIGGSLCATDGVPDRRGQVH